MIEDLILYDPRPTRSDALKNRELLLQTAQRLFEQYGVEAVSMSAIAQEAGVGKGTLYRHFENKTALCQALLDEQQRDLQNRTITQMRSVHPPAETLRWFLSEVVNFVEKNAAFLCSSMDTLPPLEHPAHLWWRQTIHGLLVQLEVAGDVDYLADTLYVMLDVRTALFQRRALGYDTGRILDGLHALVEQFVSS